MDFTQSVSRLPDLKLVPGFTRLVSLFLGGSVHWVDLPSFSRCRHIFCWGRVCIVSRGIRFCLTVLAKFGEKCKSDKAIIRRFEEKTSQELTTLTTILRETYVVERHPNIEWQGTAFAILAMFKIYLVWFFFTKMKIYTPASSPLLRFYMFLLRKHLSKCCVIAV